MGVKFYWSGFYKGDTFYCVLFKLKGCKLHISEGIKVMGKRISWNRDNWILCQMGIYILQYTETWYSVSSQI